MNLTSLKRGTSLVSNALKKLLCLTTPKKHNTNTSVHKFVFNGCEADGLFEVIY